MIMLGGYGTVSGPLLGAFLYEELRGLSDAELRNRGLSRDTLARDGSPLHDPHVQFG